MNWLTPRRAIRLAMDSPERWVVELIYTDAKGKKTHRLVSPVRWRTDELFVALCLGREEFRTFRLERCSGIRLRQASDVIMGREGQGTDASESENG